MLYESVFSVMGAIQLVHRQGQQDILQASQFLGANLPHFLCFHCLLCVIASFYS